MMSNFARRCRLVAGPLVFSQQTPVRLRSTAPLLALAFLLLAATAQAQTPIRIPAGLTTFGMTIDATSAGSEYQLELDGVMSSEPTGNFTTGEWSFAPVTLTVGSHLARARSCLNWGALGGMLCGPWSLMVVYEAANGAPGTPTNFRVTQVVVTLVP